MKRWALLVVVLYAIALTALAWPLLIASFGTELFKWGLEPDLSLWVWIWIVAGTLSLLQAALLVVPVRVASRRPVSKRWIFWPILATVLATLLLGAGMSASVYETLYNTSWIDKTEWSRWAGVVVAAFWVIWAFIFGFYSGIAGPQNFMARLTRSLIAGSIIELLVAIPAHVIARARGYCCAGFATGCGLAAGLAVALLAFGPAVFVLIVRRYASLKTSEHLPVETKQEKDAPAENAVK
jgi:hypothetical protein